MLVLGSNNSMGNVVHVVVGPESELHQDVHGATIADITPILSAMDNSKRVYLSLTRCRSEQITVQVMKAANMGHLSTFSPGQKPGEISSSEDTETSGKQDAPVQREKCQYCLAETELLPIPNYRICTACATIELNRKKSRKAKG